MKMFARSQSFRSALLAAILLLSGVSAQGASLIFSYADPAGDSNGPADVSRLVVVYDGVTGVYKITVKAYDTQPFLNIFRINVNLFNIARLPNHSLFADNLKDYNLATPHSRMILRGTSTSLPFWLIGDVVATNTAASGGVNPPGSTLYRSSVTGLPGGYLTDEDAIAFGPDGKATIGALTAQDAVLGLIDDVVVLKEDGVLGDGNANAMIAKLNAALASLNKNNSTPACNQLTAFNNQVTEFLNGVLTPAQAQPMFDENQVARNIIGCN